MRTVAVILIASFLLGGFAFTSYNYIKDSSHEMVTEIEKIESSLNISNWNKANQDLKITQAKWEKTKYWWSILLHHQEIDNIDLALERLTKYIETKGSALSLVELAVLKKLFEHISDTEALTLRNIL